MSVLSPNLGLTVDTGSDAVSIASISGNWDLIDSSPGIFTGTTAAVATKVATWGSNQTGMIVQETDGLALQWRWNGSALVRTYGLGVLSSVQNLVTNSITGTGTIFLSTTVTIPAGGRWIEVKAAVPQYNSSSTGAYWAFNILQDGTPITNTAWEVDNPSGGPPVFLYSAIQPSAGTHTYALQVYTTGTSATMYGGSQNPIVLSVVEP